MGWYTIDEAPNYSINRDGVVKNKTLNRHVRVKFRERDGREYVALNAPGGVIERYIDELLERYVP